eukprot:212254_1
MTITQTINSLGYVSAAKIAKTLQGSVWKAFNPSTGTPVILKFANKHQSQSQIAIINGQQYKVQENILNESRIAAILSDDKDCPKSIVKYISSAQSDQHHILVMEHGGNCLLDFVKTAHRCISAGCLDISEWHKIVKLIFAQMIECVAYLHGKGVCHFDLSLENFLINEVSIALIETHGQQSKMKFCVDDADSVQIKCCDFGLAERFANANNPRFGCNKYCGKRSYQSPEISSRKEIFDAKSNDVWCLGVCFFMMITGSEPYQQSVQSDVMFRMIMNGQLTTLLSHWNRQHFVNVDILSLFAGFFKREEHRVTIQQLKQCQWLK